MTKCIECGSMMRCVTASTDGPIPRHYQFHECLGCGTRTTPSNVHLDMEYKYRSLAFDNFWVMMLIAAVGGCAGAAITKQMPIGLLTAQLVVLVFMAKCLWDLVLLTHDEKDVSQ